MNEARTAVLYSGRIQIAALSHIHFHWPPWPDGTNPRECQPCRMARGCACAECSWQRRGQA